MARPRSVKINQTMTAVKVEGGVELNFVASNEIAFHAYLSDETIEKLYLAIKKRLKQSRRYD